MKIICVSFKYDEIVRFLIHMAVNGLLRTAFGIAWFEAFAAKQMRTVLFWVIMQQVVVISYWTLKMGPIGCPKMLVRNYHYALRNNPEEHTSVHLMLYVFLENKCVLAKTEILRWDYPSIKLKKINEACYTVNWWNVVLKQYACMWYSLWPSL
jgi:hypothetical protein